MAGVQGASASTSSDLVHIVFQVKAPAKESIKMTTSKGYELVEANGFKMIRKRKAPDSGPTDLPPGVPNPATGSDSRKENQPNLEVGSTSEHPKSIPASTEPGQAGAEPSIVGDEKSAPIVIELTETDAELLQTLPRGCPEQLKMQFVLNSLLVAAAAQKDTTEVQPGHAPWLNASVQCLATIFADRLEQQVNSSCVGAASLNDVPPMLRVGPGSGALKSNLQQRLRALQQEEARWLELRSKYQDKDDAPQEQPDDAVYQKPEDASAAGQESCVASEQVSPLSTDLPSSADGKADENATDTVGGQKEVENLTSDTVQQAAMEPHSALQATREEAHTRISLHVESLCAVLSKVDCLIASGEQACTLLQADYHQDKFKTFPHVNSPAWLIREITQHAGPSCEDSGLVGFGTPV